MNPISWFLSRLVPTSSTATATFVDERAGDRRQPYGKGTGRAAYDVVQRRRAANRRARVSRRINRRRSS